MEISQDRGFLCSSTSCIRSRKSADIFFRRLLVTASSIADLFQLLCFVGSPSRLSSTRACSVPSNKQLGSQKPCFTILLLCTALIMDYFLNFVVEHDKQMDIKKEASEPIFSLLSPPITPSPSFSLPSVPTTTSRRRGSISILAGSKRPRPYPSVKRDISHKDEHLMSNMGYGTWNAPGVRSPHVRHAQVQRKSSDEESQANYALQNQFMNVCQLCSCLLPLLFI